MAYKLESILYKCGQPLTGGLKTIEYIPEDWVESFPLYERNDYCLNDEIVLKPTRFWLRMKVFERTGKLSELERTTKHGKYYDLSIPATIPTAKKEYRGFFNQMSQHRYILKIQNNLGDTIIIGDKEQPLQFKANMDSREWIGQRWQHEVLFFGKKTHKAYNLDV